MALRSIAEAVYDANREYLPIVKAYLRNFAARRSSQPRFNQDDLKKMKMIIEKGLPEGTNELLRSLQDVTYVDIWDRAAENMEFLKGNPKHQTQRHQENGRKLAVALRNCRITIETAFNQVRGEMQDSKFDIVCDGIREKIDSLKSFEKAYPVSVATGQPAPAPAPLKPQTPVLILLVLTYVIFSVIFISIAWSKSTGDCGSVGDSDFWMLIPNGACQILGLLVSVYTVHRRSPEDSTAWRCAFWFLVTGIVCSLASIPVYLYAGTMWSSMISFCASTASFGVMLENATMTEQPRLKQD